MAQIEKLLNEILYLEQNSTQKQLRNFIDYFSIGFG